MKILLLLLSIALSLECLSTFATSEMTAEEPTHFFDALTNLPGDYAYFGRTVFRLENWPGFALTAGATAVGIASDQKTYEAMRRNFNATQRNKDFYNFFEETGKGNYQAMLGGAFMLTGLIAKSEKTFRVGNQIVEVVLASGLSTQLLKHIAGRQSPSSSTQDGGKWQPFTNPVEYHRHVSAHDAFPSGHVATSFATARILVLSYPDEKWLPWVTYTFTALVGAGMVATQGHWYGDYPLSIALGWNWARAVTRRNPKPQAPEGALALSHFELLSNDTRSLGLGWTNTF